jgi:hypothetical protein
MIKSNTPCARCGHKYSWHPKGYICLFYYKYIGEYCYCPKYTEDLDPPNVMKGED